jgi:hypothetical protein
MADNHLLELLLEMGVERGQAANALVATGNRSVDVALDFICNNPDVVTQEEAPEQCRLCNDTYDASLLVQEYPPTFSNKNKAHLLSLHNRGEPYEGNITYSRWKKMALPKTYTKSDTELDVREDIYQYQRHEVPDEVEWYVNFADEVLFVAYSGPLFAQDEIQVAEHPILASLVDLYRKKYKNDSSRRPYTKDRSDPSPVLIQGVQRRIHVELDNTGLYGNSFSRAPTDAITRATTIIRPPTITNLIAIEAPQGYGVYTLYTIRFILDTCYTGFMAAKLQGNGAKCAIHTGNWGTGAYGGNKVLMAMIQIIGARLAGIDKLVYHTFMPVFTNAYKEALKTLDEKLAPKGTTISVDELLDKIEGLHLRWGVSDGN